MDAEAAVELVFWAYYYGEIDRARAFERLFSFYAEPGLTYWEKWLDELDALRRRQGRVSPLFHPRAA